MYKVESKSYADIFQEFGGAELGNDGSVERYLETREEEGLILFAIDHGHSLTRFIFAGRLEADVPADRVTADDLKMRPALTEPAPAPEEEDDEMFGGPTVEEKALKGGADENDRKAPPDGGSG